MAVTTANVPKRLAETLIIDVDANVSAEETVFSGTTLANKFYYVELDNSNINAATYLKAQDIAQYNTSNPPTWRFYAPANATVTYLFPEGQSFSTGISFIATSTTDSTGTQTAPSGGTVTVKILGGT